MIGLYILGIILFWFIVWVVFSIVLAKMLSNKISMFIRFPISAFLMAVLFSFYSFGWGWFVPYSLQPSYWQFRNICKINELPNNEEKYNKILAYFDTDLDSLDYEELNKKAWKLSENNGDYKKGVFEYATLSKGKDINSRLGIIARFLSDKSFINRYNINQMSIGASWHSRRYLLDLNPYDLHWDEGTLGCSKVVKENMTPKGVKDEQ